MKAGKESKWRRRWMPLPAGSRRPSSSGRAGRRGGALILTLLVVALLTMMVIAFFASMRIEQQASHSYANSQRAKMVAQGAVSHGIELLRTHIPEPALISESAGVAPGENWAINPGRLTVFTNDLGERVIPLHTGSADVSPRETLDPNVYSVDLNEPLPGETEPPICTALKSDGSPHYDSPNPPMRVKWMTVLDNPRDRPSEANQITGRYAFWMDDECSKINFNVALGKPARDVFDPQRFWEQYEAGLMTPLFTGGLGDVEYNSSSQDREWALGKLRSINLDVLFDQRTDLDADALLAHAWLRGFSRYPEAILDFVTLGEEEREEWYRGNRFNLTFHSRSPEFNAFGRSRLFTTNIPLSLEAGPLYQLPFVYNGPDAPESDYQIEGILHLHSLMGSLGFTHNINDEELGNVHAANIVNRAQFEMLNRYLSRRWPGYNATFLDKYGEKECYQMALSMLTMARMATTTMAAGGRTASRDWAWRTTSVIYSPHKQERPGANPERHYWQIQPLRPDPETGLDPVPMLPQMPGPHITEVRLILKPERVSKTKYRIAYRYEVEYYMHETGPTLYLNDFPAKVDYLHLTARGGGRNIVQEFGPATAEEGEEDHHLDRNWNYNRGSRRNLRRSLGSLRATAGKRQRIGSQGSGVSNRVVVSSPRRFIGTTQPKEDRLSWIPRQANSGDVAKFDSLKGGGDVTVDVKWRLGMGVRPDARRPRQMIPIGEKPEDVLETSFEIDLRSGEQQVISWQINDPRLSWHKDEWIIDTENEGTPGRINEIEDLPLEPEEFSSEKSKFRYFMRGPGSFQNPENPGGRPFPLNRPDEYNSRSRVSSKGYWSVLHTGIQNREPWRTLDLGGGLANLTDPPDYLLLDLLGATYPMQHDQWRINSTLPDEFSTASFMNSTAGQINLNSRIYPDDSEFFQAPKRRKPLEAVFKHLRLEGELHSLLDGIDAHQRTDFFRYIGDLSKVGGYFRLQAGATQFEQEELLRNMAGCLTTKSNTFGLWGVSQVVKKIPGHSKWDVFEDGDQVQAEKRFFAVIERYIWPGNDGVPGNAHVDDNGIWDRIARQRAIIPRSGSTTDTLYQLPGSPPLRKAGNSHRLRLDLNGTYPWYDGPQPVEMDRYASRTLGKVMWTESTLEEAYNPPQPVIKYRVAYFKYLDE